jgi:hypothetical protein
MNLSYYKKNKVKDNLKYFFDTASDLDRISGKAWYFNANLFCEKMAVKYGLTTETVAAIVSALSPHNKWERNLIDTETVLKAVRKDLQPEDVKVCTFNSNKEKAFKIARYEEAIDISSPKTYAFLQNIAYLNDQYVTIDRWHIRASFNKMIAPKSLTKGLYQEIQDITIKEASDVNLTGYQYQAIIWESIKNTADE